MKKTFFIVMFASTLLIVPRKTTAQELSFQVFYSSLSPYGEWVTAGDYGMCWRPVGVPIGWRPYADGHWVWTDYGWTWVSDYSWGWAPFHYGRWAFDPEFGWIWVPGYVWAPAWVEWRWGGGYAGWAPMPPGFHFRVDVVVRGDDNDFGVVMGGWNFVHAEEMGSPHYAFVGREGVPRIMGSTRNVTEYRFTPRGVYSTGLPREQVERVTRRRIETVSVVRTTDVTRERVEGGQFRVYSPAPLRPQVRDERQVIQRERVRQPIGHPVNGNVHQAPPQSNPHPEAAPPRTRTQPRSGPGYQPHPQTQNKPKEQPKQKENDKGRERQTQHRDDGPGRTH